MAFLKIAFIVGILSVLFGCFYSAYKLSQFVFIDNYDGEDPISLIMGFVTSIIWCFLFAYIGNRRYDLNIPNDLKTEACKLR
jgi:hypothetical protein